MSLRPKVKTYAWTWLVAIVMDVLRLGSRRASGDFRVVMCGSMGCRRMVGGAELGREEGGVLPSLL